MNKRERLLAAVAGAEVDHPPCVAWMNFATDALTGTEAARRHLAFQQTYDWDLCKVMHDYRHPLPDGMDAPATPADLLRIGAAPLTARNFSEQLALLRGVRAELAPDTPMIETLFDPFQQVWRATGYSATRLIYAHPVEALRMLDAVTDTLCEYVEAVKRTGVDGILYAINGAIAPPGERGIDDATFRTFLRPFDLRVLEAMQGTLRILHAHGTHVDLRRVLDYPCEVISVSDRLQGNPSLAEMRRATGKCIMGGINEARLHERSNAELRDEIHDALRQAGRRGFILSPGCNASPATPERLLRCIGDTCRTAGAAPR